MMGFNEDYYINQLEEGEIKVQPRLVTLTLTLTLAHATSLGLEELEKDLEMKIMSPPRSIICFTALEGWSFRDF